MAASNIFLERHQQTTDWKGVVKLIENRQAPTWVFTEMHVWKVKSQPIW